MLINVDRVQELVKKIFSYPIVIIYFEQARALERLNRLFSELPESEREAGLSALIKTEGNEVLKGDVSLSVLGYHPGEYGILSLAQRTALCALKCEPELLHGLSEHQAQALIEFFKQPDKSEDFSIALLSTRLKAAPWFNKIHVEAAKAGVPFELMLPLDFALYGNPAVQLMDEILARLFIFASENYPAEKISTLSGSWNNNDDIEAIGLRRYLSSFSATLKINSRFKAKVIHAVKNLHKLQISERALHDLIEKILKLPALPSITIPKLAEQLQKLKELANKTEANTTEERFKSLLTAYDAYQKELAEILPKKTPKLRATSELFPRSASEIELGEAATAAPVASAHRIMSAP